MAKSKKTYIYVDGYNIINSWHELIEIKNTSLEEAREKLIDEMAEYKALSQKEVVLVFDAYNSDALKEKFVKKLGITIVYTKKFQTADTFIEKEMNRLARRENVEVCTGDAQVQSIAFERGAARITSFELKSELSSKREKIKRTINKSFEKNYTDFPVSEDFVKALNKIEKKINKKNGKIK